jgi:hypothetical protein
MTNHQDKELSSDGPHSEWQPFSGFAVNFYREHGKPADLIDAYEHGLKIGKALATSPQLPVAEQPAGQAVDTKEWLRQESSVYALNERGVNSDYINVQQADNRHDRAATNDLAERIRMLLSQPLSPVAQMSGDALEQIDLKAQAGLCAGSFSGARAFLEDIREIVASHPSNAEKP